MKCINRAYRIAAVAVAAVILTASLAGCGTKEFSFAYDRNRNNTSFSVASHAAGKTMEPFASGLCVAAGDVMAGTDVNVTATAAGLFDVSAGNVKYAKNIHEKLNPASLTKILTALCAFEHGNMDDLLVASENVKITEPGAVKIGVEPGDTMTLEQALNVLLIKSSNDVAVMIAEHIGGSLEGFAAMMNATANRLGATNSHFTNPHGLTDPDHYTTVYDLYLICNEVVEYDKFVEIISKSEYSSVYHDQNGNEKKIDLATTNAYIKKEAFAPDGVTVLGGKTGTTSAAGICLILYSKDASGDPYISVILQSDDRTVMYQEMTALLGEI